MTESPYSSAEVSVTKELEFHLEEFKSLRREIEQRIQEAFTITRNCILGSAAAVAWLATAGQNIANQSLYRFAWWLPFILCVFAALRAYGLFTRIRAIGLYLEKIETIFRHPDISGWEHNLGNLRLSTWRANAIDWISTTFWLALLAGAFIVGYVGSTTTLITIPSSG